MTAIIVGFGYNNLYTFLLAMTHFHFAPSDKPDYNMAKYSLCFSLIASYKEHSLLFS